MCSLIPKALIHLHRSTWICASNTSGTGLSGCIVAAGTYTGTRAEMSPYPKQVTLFQQPKMPTEGSIAGSHTAASSHGDFGWIGLLVLPLGQQCDDLRRAL